jgi:hypothetical protein
MNFVRSACETVLSDGRGVGGALATLRLEARGDGEANLRRAVAGLSRELLATHGITGVHVGWARPEVTRVDTRETQLRRLTGEEVFDAVVMVEGIGRREVAAAMPAAADRVGSIGGIAVTANEVYDLAFLLTAEEV